MSKIKLVALLAFLLVGVACQPQPTLWTGVEHVSGTWRMETTYKALVLHTEHDHQSDCEAEDLCEVDYETCKPTDGWGDVEYFDYVLSSSEEHVGYAYHYTSGGYDYELVEESWVDYGFISADRFAIYTEYFGTCYEGLWEDDSGNPVFDKECEVIGETVYYEIDPYCRVDRWKMDVVDVTASNGSGQEFVDPPNSTLEYDSSNTTFSGQVVLSANHGPYVVNVDRSEYERLLTSQNLFVGYVEKNGKFTPVDYSYHEPVKE